MWVPAIACEAEWLSTSHGNTVMCEQAAHGQLKDKDGRRVQLPVSVAEFDGDAGRGKVKIYLQVETNRFVILAAPDLRCVYVFVKQPTATFSTGEREAYKLNQHLAQSDGEVQWRPGQRGYVRDKIGLPNPMFVWNVDLHREFHLHVFDPRTSQVQKISFHSTQLRPETTPDRPLTITSRCPMCNADVVHSDWVKHANDHVRTVADAERTVANGLSWRVAAVPRTLLDFLTGTIGDLPDADSTKKNELLQKVHESYERFQKDAAKRGSKRKGGDMDAEQQQIDSLRRMLVAEKKSSIEKSKAHIEKSKAHIETMKALIEKTKSSIEKTKSSIEDKKSSIKDKNLLLKFMPNDVGLQQQLSMLHEELKQLEQQLASEQVELQQLKRDLKQAQRDLRRTQRDSPNNTSSTGPPNNTSSKD
eukprot:TRINITY_DN67378_c2_g1_i3.p1 TRINITY_DN67378_c2_g1~~TRINITY_DN67378_c2_g1_i3.p1  ORF type:complete len:479 (-),score=181.04 TRINITY_DN67378_c2_g1_i3:13-1266(-)